MSPAVDELRDASKIPTRADIIKVLKAEKGKGRKAMRRAIRKLRTTWPEMSKKDLRKIYEDKESYLQYLSEESE